MKILCLGLDRNNELDQLHQVKHIDYKDISAKGLDTICEEIAQFHPDVLFEREYNDGLSNYEKLVDWVGANVPGCTKAVWLIDTHVAYLRHKEYHKHFDVTFMAISKFVDEFNKDHPTFWLPLCYPGRSDSIKRRKDAPEHDIVFVGRWGSMFPERTRLLGVLARKYGNKFYGVKDYENMEKIIQSSIISFNCSIEDDMNFRVFESMANGVEVVTNEVPDLYKIEGLSDRINIYRNDEELISIIDRILDLKLEKEVIKNQYWIRDHHCLIHRHTAMLSMLSSFKQFEF